LSANAAGITLDVTIVILPTSITAAMVKANIEFLPAIVPHLRAFLQFILGIWTHRYIVPDIQLYIVYLL